MKFFVVLVLLSTSAFAREFVCVLDSVDAGLLEERKVIVNEAYTKIDYGIRGDLMVSGLVSQGEVSVSMKHKGNLFYSTGMGKAEIKMYTGRYAGAGSMTLSCRVVE